VQSKFAAQVVERYEQALAAEARRLGLDGVICGHIHYPRIRHINGVLYINDGDWVCLFPARSFTSAVFFTHALCGVVKQHMLL
jgi:UDP-2,3-diacylglucosamine pyrophosphatase LpxH